MERKNKIITQEQYAEIRAKIMRLELQQTLTGKDNSEKIKELKALIE